MIVNDAPYVYNYDIGDIVVIENMYIYRKDIDRVVDLTDQTAIVVGLGSYYIVALPDGYRVVCTGYELRPFSI